MLRITFLAAALCTVFAAPASAVGPAPGESASLVAGGVHYRAVAKSGATRVSARGASARLAGSWGFPRVTFGGAVEGLSADGKSLVLVRRTHGALVSPTRFVILDPKTLHVRKTVAIPGRFAFDALSPDASRLYLIEYVSVVGELRYRVRGYDLAAGRLEQGVIADKRSGWTAMQGEPLTRATSGDGTWAYTLYGNDTKPFVHALNTAQGYAVCIDLPLGPAAADGSRLRLDGARLTVVAKGGRAGAVIDTRSLQVVRQ
jgi:hypothetical protein